MSLLLIEDDADQRELMAQLLSLRQIEADTAASLASARKLLSEHEYEAVITDYSLPDGFTTELFGDGLLDPARTLLLTGHVRVDVPSTVPIFRKPIPLEKFFSSLSEILGRDLSPDGAGAHAREPDAEDGLELVLYVAGDAPAGRAARRNLERALGDVELPHRLEIIDLADEPERADPADRVLFTPTLVRRSPRPRVWLIGDLADRDLLESTLGAS